MSEPPFDLSRVLAQAQELGGKLQRVQEELRRRTVETTVGGGMVEARMNGAMELVSLRIDPRAVDPRDVDMLQDLIVAAVNQAMKRAQEMVREEMQRATGLPLSSLMEMLGPSR
ncbi:MAG: YbaB/EbfC family nucleoid-associated protein [Myxococcota bacterium]